MPKMSTILEVVKTVGPVILIILAVVYATSDRNMEEKSENPGGRFST